ncbi:MAG: ABC transporter permease [Pseudomonadota bacterium]
MVLREMITTYGRSPGGWLWALIEPVAAIALLSFAFSLAFRDPPLGRDFALFYATGFLPYMLFHDVSAKVASAVRFSRPLMSFGRVRFIDAILARALLNTVTHVVIGAVVLIALLISADTGVAPDLTLVSIAYAMAVALAVGVGTLNCYLFTAFPAWERLWSIAMRPLFIVSGVIFLLEDVPATFQPILLANPLFHVTGLMRMAVYPSYEPLYPSLAFVFGLAVGLCLLGLLVLDRFADEVLHK